VKRWMIVCAIATLSAGGYLLVEVSNANLRSSSRAGTPRVAPEPVAPNAMNWHERPSLMIAVKRGELGPAEARQSDEHAAPGPPATADELRAQLEASFVGDPPVAPSQDRASGLEKRVRAVIPAGSSVRSLECRRSLCRIETMHPSLEEFRDFVQRGYLALDFATRVSNGPVFVGLLASPVEGQPVFGVAFLGRDGAVLPTRRPNDPGGSF
jgi:hypothetical protein